MEARHQAIVTIKRTLNEAGMVIPFPIRTIDFAIKGGDDLASMLKQSQLHLQQANQPTKPAANNRD